MSPATGIRGESHNGTGYKPPSERRGSLVVDTTLAGEEDAAVLAKMGFVGFLVWYKQELRRNFSTLEVAGLAFSIMGLLPSIASTLSYSIPAGPVGLVWGWFLASGFIFIVGLAMSDLASSMPTSGVKWSRSHPNNGES
ncbi:hypothetical protein CLCR_07722 [Cladophialophora carrionii]|uniref:Uncharacterized protein n=1 Tax=Cladophialophora carrionii TaxID=86049 RepID=A0A1C1CN27_9EURO|nr:hypothetical protein CLCR_07722 [Cladophialophora carrionii]